MKNCLVLVAIAAIFCGAKAGLLDDEAKILTDFKQKYNNSQSDIIFLMDVSGSVSPYGFDSEKIFIDNMLNEFSVAPYSTRVAVLTFGTNVKTDINYIDIDPTSLTHQKCEFKPWFDNNVDQRGGLTNMKEAFLQSSKLLQTAMNNKHRRSNIHTVAIMITDGYWNLGDPRANANTLKSTYGADVITVGVDGYSRWQLEQLATSADHVLGYETFTKFRELALYIRGGKKSHRKSTNFSF